MKKYGFILLALILAFSCSLGAGAVAGEQDESVAQYDVLIDTGEADPNADPKQEPQASSSPDVPADETTYKEEPYAENTAPPLSEGAAGSGELEDILTYWEENGYPSNVSFAYEAGGEVLDDGTHLRWWEIGMVDADESQRQEILKLVAPACRVTFADCNYSYAEREAVLNEIIAKNDANIAQVFLGKNTEHVFVEISADASDEALKEYATQLRAEYGQLVEVMDEDHIIDELQTLPIDGKEIMLGGNGTVTGIGSAGLDQGNAVVSNPWGMGAMLFVLLIGAVFLLASRARRVPAMQTNNGSVVTSAASLSKREVVEAVKSSEMVPDDETFASILDKIEP